MFNFKKKTVNPLVRAALSEIDFAFKVEGVAKKIEKLISVREQVQEEFAKVGKGEDKKRDMALTALLIGYAVTGLAFMTAAGGGLAIAATIGGGVLMLSGLTGHLKTIANRDRANADKDTLLGLLDGEVGRLAASSPQEAVQSPRFLQTLKQAFGKATENTEKNAGQLRARVAFTPAAPAV